MPAPADGANKAADPPELEFRLKDGSSPVCGLVVAPDGKTIVAGSLDGKLRGVGPGNPAGGSHLLRKRQCDGPCASPGRQNRGGDVSDGSLFTWDIEKGEVIGQFTGYPVHPGA